MHQLKPFEKHDLEVMFLEGPQSELILLISPSELKQIKKLLKNACPHPWKG
jgi:hypothetical protein